MLTTSTTPGAFGGRGMANSSQPALQNSPGFLRMIPS